MGKSLTADLFRVRFEPRPRLSALQGSDPTGDMQLTVPVNAGTVLKRTGFQTVTSKSRRFDSDLN